MRTNTRQYRVNSKTNNFEVPAFCPHCNNPMSPDCTGKSEGGVSGYFVVGFCCTHPDCKKEFICLSRENGVSYTLIYCHPPIAPGVSPSNELVTLSSHFAKLYRQAQETEAAGNHHLAACGYRNAIEALVKDYAHKYHAVPLNMELAKLPLDACITRYIDGMDEAVAAYVVKDLGNNATHYPPDPENPFDFEEQKLYLDLFLSHITGKVKLREKLKSLNPKKQETFAAKK